MTFAVAKKRILICKFLAMRRTSIIELTNELEHLEQVQKELMTGEPKYVLKP